MKLVMGFLLAILAFSGTALAGGRGGPASPWRSGNIVVAVIKNVPGGDWTYANPPLVEVEVVEVLNGGTPKGKLMVQWGGSQMQSDTTGARAAETEARKTMQLVPPKVGEKWVITGYQSEAVFYSVEGGRLPWTAEAEAKIRSDMVLMEKASKEAQARAAEEARKFEAERAAWLAGVTDDAIAKWVAEADVVAVTQGETVATEFLKGGPRQHYTDDKHYMSWADRAKSLPFVMRDEPNTPHVVFASERGMVCIAGGGYFPVGDGFLPADDAMLKRVRAAVKADTSKKRVTIALCGPWVNGIRVPQAEWQASPGTVLISAYRLTLDDSLAQKISGELSGVDYVLCLAGDRATGNPLAGNVCVTVMRLTTRETVLEEHWPKEADAAMSERLKDAVERVVKMSK